ncbi:c-type cytochrome [Geomonas sp.]|uniref:c-type cytochrome n=1 Tax=Geomonas sp. TaxID=2651584 RepID=UPI002B4955A0|nr:c-type cytochrome [Geomonas sp.]HJV37106.1 c-type cytochrome [Geomonas sp.]
MHRRIVVTLAVLAFSISGMAGCKKQQAEQAPANAPAPPATAPVSSAKAAPPSGAVAAEALYKQYCAACHPDGGNTINPKKTLHAKDMAANNVKTSDDIVKLMRTPGPGMTKFDTTTISDDDAKKIADYILATFH